MAIQYAYTDHSGVDHAQAYHEVITVDINFFNKAAVAQVAIYRDQAAKIAGLNPVASKLHVINGENFDTYLLGTIDVRQRVEAYLLTLPEYENAIKINN